MGVFGPDCPTQQLDSLSSRVVWNENHSLQLLIKESFPIQASQPGSNRPMHSIAQKVSLDGLLVPMLPIKMDGFFESESVFLSLRCPSSVVHANILENDDLFHRNGEFPLINSIFIMLFKAAVVFSFILKLLSLNISNVSLSTLRIK